MYKGFTKNCNILTPIGLVNVENLTSGTQIFSFNMKNKQWEIDVVKDVRRKQISTNILRINTRCGDIEISPHNYIHKLLVGNFNKHYGYDKEIVIIPVEKLLKEEYIIQPTALNSPIDLKQDKLDILPIVQDLIKLYTPQPTLNEELDWLWLGRRGYLKQYGMSRYVDAYALMDVLAWYTAEGYCKKDCYTCNNAKGYKYASTFGQSLKANLDKCDLIKSSIDNLGIRANYSFSKVLFNNIPKEMTIRLTNVISLLTQSCGCYSSMKKIPDWLMNILLSNSDLRERYLFIIGLGDGFNTEGKHSRGFCSNSVQLIKDMITLIQLSGYHYTIYKEKTKTKYITYNKVGRKSCLISIGQAKFVEVLNIEEQKYEDTMLEICVKNNHNLLIGQYGQLLCADSTYNE